MKQILKIHNLIRVLPIFILFMKLSRYMHTGSFKFNKQFPPFLY